MHRRKLQRKGNAPKVDPKMIGKGAMTRFHGIYIGHAVIVRDQTEMIELFASGSYGKGNLSRAKPLYGTSASVPKKRRIKNKKPARATGFHIHDAPQRPDKRQALAVPVLPVQEEAPENEGSDGDFSEDEGDENEKAEGAAAHAEPVPPPAAAEAFPYGNAADEALQLSLEEAFFLMYGMGVLSIASEDSKPLTVRECWQLFSKSQPYFVTTYVAYHFYRSHNWCVKSGLKLGVEFVLYKKGPEYFHAQHAVIVLNAEAETKRELPSLHSRSWASVLNVNRVSEQVAKGLLVCYVLQPRDFDAAELVSPECIKRFSVQELQIRRFVA